MGTSRSADRTYISFSLPLPSFSFRSFAKARMGLHGPSHALACFCEGNASRGTLTSPEPSSSRLVYYRTEKLSERYQLQRKVMMRTTTALRLSSFLAIAGAALIAPTVSNAQPVAGTYVACNQYGECCGFEWSASGQTRRQRYYNTDCTPPPEWMSIYRVADLLTTGRDGMTAMHIGTRIRFAVAGGATGGRHRRTSRSRRLVGGRLLLARPGGGRAVAGKGLDAPPIQPPIGGVIRYRLRRFGEKVWISSEGLLPARSRWRHPGAGAWLPAELRAAPSPNFANQRSLRLRVQLDHHHDSSNQQGW